MRQTLLFGGLQSAAFNINHKNRNIRFFEFGNCYSLDADNAKDDQPLSKYREEYRLGLWISGKRVENNWAHQDENTSVFELKAHVENIFRRVGIKDNRLTLSAFSNEIYTSGMVIVTASGRTLGSFGTVRPAILKMADIDSELYYAELSWDAITKEVRKNNITFAEISKFPEAKRDLALLVDTGVTFADIRKTALETERKLLKKVVLFDVYEGANLLAGKKSYAVSFYLQDDEKTLNDKQIDGIMERIRKNLEDKLGAALR
jgi:phenylalanyl-tRNA synthetase beta chain